MVQIQRGLACSLVVVAACRAAAVPSTPPARPTSMAPIEGTTFGYDRAATVEVMRLAKLDGDQVWLGQSGRRLPLANPKLDSTTLDSAAGAPGAAVVSASPPGGDPLLALDGVTVHVLDDELEVVCTGTLRSPRLVFAGFIKAELDSDVIAAVTAAPHARVTAMLDAPCQGEFVRGVRAAAVRSRPARSDAIPDEALAELRQWDEATQDGQIDQLVIGDAGFVMAAVHTRDACDRQERHQWTLYSAERGAQGWSLSQVADGEGEDRLVRVLDLDGDGELDALSAAGSFAGGRWQSWSPDLRIFWPAGLGCDGYDPSEDAP